MNRTFNVTNFGNIVVVNDRNTHKTHRVEFATRQEAHDAVMELTVCGGSNFKQADLRWLQGEATRSQYVARGIIVA